MKYSLKEIFLDEAALGIEDLPEDAVVRVVLYKGAIKVIVIKKDSNSSKDIFANISAYEPYDHQGNCLNAFIVGWSKTNVKGLGPFVYDLLLELAGETGVTPDRESVSKSASKVWKYYFFNRNDVEKKPLDDIINPKTPPKEDDCLFISSQGDNSDGEIEEPWLNYVYYKTNQNILNKLKELNKVSFEGTVKEGMVPQGSADERPLHGAPTYFYPTGRSLPKHMQDDGATKKARKWNKDGSLLNVDKLEDEQKEKKQWYKLEHSFKESVVLDSNKRYHVSNKKLRKFSIKSIPKQEVSFKPKGFWYACGDAWLRFAKGEGLGVGKYLYEIEINDSNVLKLNTAKQLEDFTEEFSPNGKDAELLKGMFIDWPKVAEKWDGIELCPYVSEKRYSLGWYNTLDVASGCIWNKKAIKKIKLVEKLNESHGNKINWAKIKKTKGVADSYKGQVNAYVLYIDKQSGRPIAGVDYSKLEGEDEIYIDFIGVKPDWKGKGLGKALVRDLAKEYGYKNINWGMVTDEGEKLKTSMEKEMEPFFKRGYDLWGRSLKETFLNEFSSLSTAAIVAGNIKPSQWDSYNAPRVDKKKIEKNKEYVKKLDVTTIKGKNGIEVAVDKTDPQYKRQISIVKNDNVIDWKEPEYLKGKGEHRISKLGYAKIADRNGDLKTDIYLSPYDPNWRRSQEMVQQIVKHWIKNHGNPGAFPEPDATMYVSIKEEWQNLKDNLFAESAESQDEFENIEQHLKARGLDPEKTKVITDLATNTAVFLLYNLSGKLVGFQQYYPQGPKNIKAGMDPRLAKYFTWVTREGNKKSLAVWGLETVDKRPFMFLTEGIFDAIKLQNEGLPAIAVLGNDPKMLQPWLKALQKYVIAVTDNDAAGRKLKNLADLSLSTPEPYKDLGEMPQDEISVWLARHLPSSIFEEATHAKSLWHSLKEYYPHDPAVNYHKVEPGIENDFNTMNQIFYHGSNKEFAPGDYILPPAETGEISEKGRKKNLDKVFFTLDKGSAKIYAGRAKQSFGSGSPSVYIVRPIGEIEWLNKKPGTTVLMAPAAMVVKKI